MKYTWYNYSSDGHRKSFLKKYLNRVVSNLALFNLKPSSQIYIHGPHQKTLLVVGQICKGRANKQRTLR